MVNCNPETVSTDYDTSDRLYFEPLTAEDVMEILPVEQENGDAARRDCAVRRANPAETGPCPARRPVFRSSAPPPMPLIWPKTANVSKSWSINSSSISRTMAWPTTRQAVNCRPNRLSFAASARVTSSAAARWKLSTITATLERYMTEAVSVSGDSPVLLDRYLGGAIEVDVDALCDGTTVHVAGIMQHIEEAGVHSGDSACSLPPFSLIARRHGGIASSEEAWRSRLNVDGLMNVQFAVKDGEVYLIEVNPRASRTVPFVAKAIGAPDRQICCPDYGRRTLDVNFDLVRIPPASKACGGEGGGPAVRTGSPASIRCSGRKCAPRARSSAWMTPSPRPS